ncbi:MAG: bifunctional diguanylate cyclase/phosphodiesterase [Bacilli bacterium]
MGINEQIKESRQTKKTLERLAFYDSLTNLPTRTFLLKNNYSDLLESKDNTFCDIDRLVKDSQQSALMFLDIDDFKLVNDYLGHFNGDQLLKQIADRLKSIINEDDLIIHLSGDEFIIIVNNIDKKINLHEIANKIIKTIDEVFSIGEKIVSVSCSLGASIYPDHGTTIEELLKKADIAMYEAKKKGKNNYLIFEPDFNIYFSNRYVLVDELKDAINNNDFVVHYQPKVLTESNDVFSYEALARWNHPVDGLISPNLFIPAAEELKLIDQLDKIMITNICRDLKSRIDSNKQPFPVSINISTLFFNDIKFCDILFEIFDEYEIDTSLITIEITESIAIRDFEDTISKINKLKNRNIKIAIDDFGKGYSSLTYIKLLPLDYLKIDKMFIDGLLDNNIDEAIVRYSIEISNLIGIKTIAEGVETSEQLDHLKKLGCYAYQGYLYYKPKPLKDLDI